MELLVLSLGFVVVAILASRWPVQTVLGLYAFLLPFDSVLIAGGVGPVNLHLTWFVAAAACATLLVLGLTIRGFRRLPVSALWWLLFVVWALATAAWALDPADA